MTFYTGTEGVQPKITPYSAPRCTWTLWRLWVRVLAYWLVCCFPRRALIGWVTVMKCNVTACALYFIWSYIICSLTDTINITSQLICHLPMIVSKTDSLLLVQLSALLTSIGTPNPAAAFTSEWARGTFSVWFMVSGLSQLIVKQEIMTLYTMIIKRWLINKKKHN
jgi:hypothetical protein